MTPRRHVFPPALVPVLRERWAAHHGELAELDEGVIERLLTTVFFAALETYEGEHGAIRVVFLGRSDTELVMPEGTEANAALVYRWKVLRFETPRPFAIRELVKLAVASADDRMYAAVRAVGVEELAIIGLAREGSSSDADPFIKVVAARPGCLSIRSGRDRLLEYERGAILTGGEDVVTSVGSVRRALEAAARAAGMEDDGIPSYLEAVRALVAELAAHGRGGILVVSRDEEPRVAQSAAYRMAPGSSIVSLLRLSRRLRRRDDSTSFGYLLRSAFDTEIERMIEEYGALTAIDGATVLNSSLALVAFGVVLPVGRTVVVRAGDRQRRRTIDLGSRGTRHRASATYAAEHPGSVVFVASEDGQVSCMSREPSEEDVVLWYLGPAEAHAIA